MATIKAIDGRSVHQIQSGQVIVDLNSVVKELVENSLDAGATSIEVRFKNNGLDCIEVQDNGKGIAPHDFATVALKHHTSKLSSYDDLTSLETFGFRGEALSSLCALSKFHILTARAEDGAVGKRLDFEPSGALKGTAVVASPKGTTVYVEELFHNLPVRRKELEKNIKREYGKVIGLLHAYACISVGVRFAVSNQMPKGKKMTVFSTKSNTTTKENIVNVFGTKALLGLLKLDLHLELEPTSGSSTQNARKWATHGSDGSKTVQVQGHISKPIFGEGRQATDRQLFFVNSRPCFLPQVSKAINEVYKSFNVTQSPFIFANLVMDTNAYDVNVSPDKRTILLHDQTALLESMKASLTELFDKTDHTVPQSQLQNGKLSSFRSLTVPQQSTSVLVSASGQNDAGSDSGDSGEESEAGERSVATRSQRRGISNDTVASPNLVESWACRNTELRKDKPAIKQPVILAAENKTPWVDISGPAIPAANGEHPQLEPSKEQDANSEDDEIDEDGENYDMHSTNMTTQTDPMSTPYDNLVSHPPTRLPSRVQQLNYLVEHIQAEKEHHVSSKEDHETEIEHPVQVIAPASRQKASPGPIQNAFDRMRPKRTPIQTAEITIGNTTTTTVIGSTSMYKKRRIHEPVNPQAIDQFGASPLLARGLRNFAAPGSRMEIDSSDGAPSGPQRENDSEDQAEDEISESEQNDESEVGSVASNSEDDASSDQLPPLIAEDDEADEDYVDERKNKILEDQKVARMILEAEEADARPTDANLKRASLSLRNGGNRKDSTLNLLKIVKTSVDEIRKSLSCLKSNVEAQDGANRECTAATVVKDDINDVEAEKRLSLTVSKADFGRMIIVGQYNLGFILAIRPATEEHSEDDLFIIDQHAADEKYNYERLQRTVTLQSQRLVRPKLLELTAVEEEIILNHSSALKANGFEIENTILETEEGCNRIFRLLTLPISGEKTFDLSDLSELLHLLSESPSGSLEIPRPRKVQRMLAMRACRSSIMVGKTLTTTQMHKVVRHMGEMEKPWNCPHGRPTMRHLAGLGAWSAWHEGDWLGADEENAAFAGRETDWKAWLAGR
ncbi:Hypothetical protein R9X50_00038300 [Acrodontium crateriforme]|uniref:DNA mismatch repair protein PMS1 n=1 Tax=Acrodontium crateriforme TaxID=150365 RepID=A0AAQ3LYP6_9PEZI|nr:Hypothetical protein R9X50_00038300 [Acrodontium crateriforme]